MLTREPSNPPPPDEAELLAWVEGEPLSPEANAAVARILLADPALARRLELMRQDRQWLCSIPDEQAPRDLVASVEAALQPVLERELLLGLQNAEPIESNPVVSMVRPERRGIFQTFLADRTGRRMALAASLLLMIGGAVWWAAGTFTGSPSPIRPIARNDAAGGAPPGPESLSDSALAATTIDSSAAASLAMTETFNPEAAASVLPADEEVSTKIASAEELVGPVRTAMDAALAAELARERKLVVRVVSREASTAPRRVCDRVRKELNSPAIRLASEVPPELTLALDVRPLDVPRRTPITPEAPVFAAIDSAAIFVGPPAPREVPIIEETEPQPLYVVQARLDAATMAQLRTSLERAGREEVVFEERYEPLPLASGGAPVLTPQAVLWWSNPPAGWTSWGEVPVVIESR